MVIKRSPGGEFAGGGRSTWKSTCEVPGWLRVTAFGDQPASSTPVCPNLAPARTLTSEFDRINWPLTSEMFTFWICARVLQWSCLKAVSVSTFVLGGLRGFTATSDLVDDGEKTVLDFLPDWVPALPEDLLPDTGTCSESDQCLHMSISTFSVRVVSPCRLDSLRLKFTNKPCRWGFGWVDKGQCFWSAWRIGAVWLSPDFSTVFAHLASRHFFFELAFYVLITTILNAHWTQKHQPMIRECRNAYQATRLDK